MLKISNDIFGPDELFQLLEDMKTWSDFAIIFNGENKETATLFEINSAFQQWQIKCDPNKYPNFKKMAETVWQRIQLAYKNITDPENRIRTGNEYFKNSLKESVSNPKQAEFSYKRACFEYEVAIELDDKNAVAWLKLGGLLISKREVFISMEGPFKSEHEKILQCLKKAIELNPESCDAYLLLANYLKDEKEQRHYVESLYHQALTLKPTAQIYCDRGEFYLSTGELNKAFLDFSEAAKLDPKLEQAQKGLIKAEEVTLVINQKELKCKRTKLIEFEYFKKLLQGSFKESTQSSIVIQEGNYDNFKELIEFAHERTVNFTQNNVFGIMQLADKYLITKLILRCIDFLNQNLEKNFPKSEALKVLEFAEFHNYPKLSEICIKVIKMDYSWISNSVFTAFDGYPGALKALLKTMNASELNSTVNSRRILDKAISQNNTDVVTLLGEKGCEAQYQNYYSNSYYTPLILAAEQNNFKMLTLLFDKFKFNHANSYGVNHCNDKNMSALHHAVKHKNLEMAKLLLQQLYARVNSGSTPTPFELAFNNRDKDMLKLLIQYGAKAEDTHYYNNISETYYHTAARLGLTEILECFPQQSTALTAFSQNKCPLHLAMDEGHLKTIEFLFKLCPTAVDSEKRNAMHYLALSKKGESLLPAFKDVNVHELFVIDTNYYSNNLPIHYAMLNGNWAVTQFFIDNGALDKFVYDTAFLSHGDKTPFDCACAKGLRDFVLKSIKYLVENRSKDNPNLINHLLHWAALREYFEIVKYLVEEHKADVNFHLTPDSSFLHTASSKGRLEAVRFLVKNKADVNYQNSKNRTPLHEAAENAHPKVVKHLLQSGCKASFWDNEGRTAYHLAVKMKNSERGYGDTPYDEIIEDLSQSECKIQ